MAAPLLVRDLMTQDVVTVNRNDKLSVADDVMRLGRIRHMPVLDEDGELVGMVSQRDLFHNAVLKALGYGSHAQAKTLDMCVVKEAMTEPVQTTAPSTPLQEAAKLMADRKIGCLVVTDQGKVVGILTEGDFVKLVADGR